MSFSVFSNYRLIDIFGGGGVCGRNVREMRLRRSGEVGRLLRSFERWLGRGHEIGWFWRGRGVCLGGGHRIGWLMRSLEMWVRSPGIWLRRNRMSHFGRFGSVFSTFVLDGGWGLQVEGGLGEDGQRSRSCRDDDGGSGRGI